MHAIKLAVFVAIAVVVSILCGLLVFPHVPLARQFELASYLSTTAATLFAILGVWIAVLDPKSLLDNQVAAEPSSSRTLAAELLRPWLFATSVFAIAVLLTFVLGVLPNDWDGIRAARQVPGVILTFLLLLLLYTLLGTLLPVAHLQRRERVRQMRQAYRR